MTLHPRDVLMELLRRLPRLIRETHARFFCGDASALTMRELFYLDMIDHLAGPTAGELAARLRVSRPTASTVIRKLERSGTVRKEPSKTDRRSYRLRLTARGRRLVDEHDICHAEIVRQFETHLTAEELVTAVGLFTKVIRALDSSRGGR